MSVNPVVLVQLLYQYSNYHTDKRTFRFVRNNRMRVHAETQEEISSRKSVLSAKTVETAEKAVRGLLNESLNGKLGKVYIDPGMKSIAVPVQSSASNNGFGVLPAGSRVKIPEGKKIRAFTYWEKVNDIDISCFGLTEDGKQEEFSWRTMWNNQGEDITFSGDETSGYNGGSEYFDIHIDKFRKNHPNFRYVVFCDNVYSGIPFNKCFCKAGFMMRDELDSGMVYEPKTVKSAYLVDGDGLFNYMFALDLEKREIVWLNICRSDSVRVAGSTDMGFLLDYLNRAETFSLYDLFSAMGEVVNDPSDAEIIVADIPFTTERTVIHSYDVEKVLKYIDGV